VLVAAILTPLWASYLVKAYAWRTMLADGGVLNWALGPLGIQGPGFGLVATTTTLAYLWLPYMILPIYAGLDRLPNSLLEASGDLGATAWRTFRSVVLPLVFPSIVAGSIFTFSLSLGDYITVKIVGGSTQLFANVIYDNIGVAGNLPFAAAAALVPVLAIVVYLLLVRRSGALDNL
jgi:putative spermidine/putrescine transport system permease protein